MRGLLFVLAVSMAVAEHFAQAVVFLTGPSFTPAANAPLAGVLQLTTDVESRVSIAVDDGEGGWRRSFYDFATAHQVTLLGFKPGRTNLITVTVYDKNRNQASSPQSLIFGTDPLPDDFPNLTLLQSSPQKMEPGYTLFRVAMNGNRKAYQTIVNSVGEVVWYASVPSGLDVRQLGNGDLLIFSATAFLEIDLLGNTLNTWPAPTGFRIDNHEGLVTDHGTILYLSAASTTVSDYPSSTTDPNAPLVTASNVVYEKVVEISATNSALVNNWSLINMLDPRRITYLTTLGPMVWDSEHANAVIEDPRDNSIIVSLRHQNAVVKFSRATGQLIWILGPHENWGPEWQPYLLTPVGIPFEWQYGQHSPIITPRGTLILYDDGNFRATPFDPPVADSSNYSRAVEYDINEHTMEVSQVWDYGRTGAETFYTDKVGGAEPLPETGNVLVTFGSVKYVNGAPPSSQGPNATMARIQEVTHDLVPEVVFDLALTEYDNPNTAYGDCFVYRSYRIPDLYAHPAVAVANLTVGCQDGTARLEFSADPTRAYSVEASTDLLHWTEIGLATPGSEEGDFQFQESGTDQFKARYYRVVTH